LAVLTIHIAILPAEKIKFYFMFDIGLTGTHFRKAVWARILIGETINRVKQPLNKIRNAGKKRYVFFRYHFAHVPLLF
jgi:hypothetical protein